MATRIGTGALACTLLLAGCATTATEKPMLTAAAVNAIVRQCGAVGGRLRRDATALPFAEFVVPRDEPAIDDDPTKTVKCIGERLTAYRYSMFSLAEDKVAAPAMQRP